MFPGRIVLAERVILKRIHKEILKGRVLEEKEPPKGRYKLILKGRNRLQVYFFDQPSVLFDPRTGRQISLEDRGACLEPAVERLNAMNPYGKFLPWSEVDKIFCKFDRARVVDLETGLSFLVQRRAGSKHADVQPLTAEDSAVMKKIYGGRWSWRRRAIIVEVKGYRIAASMNGMPHGAGAIAGNDFDGHFCIHFRDSKTHSNEENLAHMLMVWKAAGMVEEMLAGAGPKRILAVTLTAIEQGDYPLASRFIRPLPGESEQEIIRRLNRIKWMAVSEISDAGDGKGDKDYEAKVSYELKDGTSFRNRPVRFTLAGDSGKIPWKISAESVNQLIEKQKEAGEAETLQDGGVHHE